MRRAANASVEKWFLRRGLSALLTDTRHQTSTANRALPALIVLFLLALTSPVFAGDGHTLTNLAIALGAMLVTWVGANLARKSAPFSRVDRIGWAEIAVFVLVPTAVAAVAVYQEATIPGIEISATAMRWITTGVTFVTQVLLLLLVLALVKYGVVAIIIWLSRQMIGSIAVAGTALFRTLPLLMGVVLFVFLSSEMWQSLGRLDSWAFTGVMAMFVVLSGMFLSRREQLNVSELSTFTDRDELRALLVDTPMAGRSDEVELPARVEFNPAQEANLRLVATLARLSIAAVVASAVFAFFFLFGFMVIDAKIVADWGHGQPDVLWTITTAVHQYDLTAEHLRVCTFLAVFAGFYFSIVSATDPVMRAGMADTSSDMIRQASAVRLALVATDGEGSAARSAHSSAEPDDEVGSGR